MKIKSIGYCSIRELNPNPDQTGMIGDFRPTMEYIKPGKINLFIGDNGSGKSTILDIVHSSINTTYITSLPREFPFSQTTPAFDIVFSNGNSFYSRFKESSKEIGFINIFMVWRTQYKNFKLTYLNVNRYKPGDDLNNQKEGFNNYACETFGAKVFYKPDVLSKLIIDENLINELNLIHPVLRGVYDKNEDFIEEDLPNVGATFNIRDENKLDVRFSNDHRATNNLLFNWLPSGWKSYLSTVLWLKNCDDKSICIMEEPEVHLNPRLQRVLMKRIIEISEEKKMQIFMSTHSASIIDYEYEDKLKLFHAKGNQVFEIEEKSKALLNELGYKASDILHPNCIIWVEGPSDQVYLEHWINSKMPSLIKYVHFSIVTYGGSLLKHMSLNPATERNLIFTSMNPNSFVIIDSDKTGEFDYQQYNAQRFNVFENVWITDGRAIENYIEHSQFKNCVKLCYPRFDTSKVKSGKWDNLLDIENKEGNPYSFSKPKIAKAYAENITPDFSVYDLENRLDQVCNFIIDSNKY